MRQQRAPGRHRDSPALPEKGHALCLGEKREGMIAGRKLRLKEVPPTTRSIRADLCVIAAEGGTSRRLTACAENLFQTKPCFSPDGR